MDAVLGANGASGASGAKSGSGAAASNALVAKGSIEQVVPVKTKKKGGKEKVLKKKILK